MEFLREYLDYGILGILGGMSFLMLWFGIERLLYFRRVDLSRFEHIEDLNLDLTRHLTLIASIGANAPYVGLLGTVLGILLTFYDIGTRGSLDTSTIMLGLAFALKATALGLVVAIPAIILFNALLRRVEVLTVRWKRGRGG